MPIHAAASVEALGMPACRRRVMRAVFALVRFLGGLVCFSGRLVCFVGNCRSRLVLRPSRVFVIGE